VRAVNRQSREKKSTESCVVTTPEGSLPRENGKRRRITERQEEEVKSTSRRNSLKPSRETKMGRKSGGGEGSHSESMPRENSCRGKGGGEVYRKTREREKRHKKKTKRGHHMGGPKMKKKKNSMNHPLEQGEMWSP